MGNILSTSSSIKNNTIWKDKVAVITGGGQGMGAKMAEIFASRGIKGLALADINAEKLEETAGYIYQMLSEEERKYPPHDKVITMNISFEAGPGKAIVLGSDLTKEYVSINADYRS